MWLNGGPGASSMLGLLNGNGPCYVHVDSNSTYLNEWSWNAYSNMLYIDQPVQVGFSYDRLQNITKNLATNSVSLLEPNDDIPEQNTTFLVGTSPSREINNTAQGVRNAAKAVWHFMQTFTEEFPAYQPNNSKISVTTESFGGRWGPELAAYFEQQNHKIDNDTMKGCNGTSEAKKLDLDTLLIINGCADRLTMWPNYVKMASNNTYGIKAINGSQVQEMEDAWDMPGGCRDQVMHCHEAARIGDPKNLGYNATVNAICEQSETFCYSYIMDGYRNATDRGYFDIGTIDGSSPKFHQAFLNQPHVQKAIGVPLNWTSSSNTVKSRFQQLGAYPRDASLGNMAYLLDNGGKVALMYGDRDLACNWYGGEQVSLAIPHSEQGAFKAAGYTPLMTNASYSGGQVRQHGNLSFSRVYEAGHEVASYQPETAYRVFMRAIFGLDIPTGQVSAHNYTTIEPEDTYNILNKPLDPQPLRYCYSWSQGSCSDDEKAAMLNGSATVCSYILKDKNSTQLFPEITGKLDELGCGMGVAHY